MFSERKVSTGDIVKGIYWKNPVKILNLERIGSSIQIKTIDTKTSYIEEEIIVDPRKLSIIQNIVFNREFWHWAIESWRIQYYDFNEEQLAPIISNINIEPYQIEAVYEYILRSGPIRYLIAHDPGAGKTIIAGMVIKEIDAREILKNILIIVPPGIIPKWQLEMANKFNDTDYKKITGSNWKLIKEELRNPWNEYNKVIMSPYFALRKIEHLPEDKQWDLVLIDEVHKFNNPKAEKYHHLISTIAKRCRHLLLLTATPHDGHQEHFLTLIRYLIPNISLTSAHQGTLGSLMIKRTKEELFHANGEPVFLPRVVGTFKLEMSFDESIFYTELIQFIEQVFGNNQAIHLIKIVYQRRFSSSLAALKSTLYKRLQFLNNNENDAVFEEETFVEEGDDSDLITDDEKEVINLKTKMELISFEKTKIKELINKLEMINFVDAKKWKKLNHLFSQFEEFKDGPETAKKKGAKLLIFTEFKDTLNWIVDQLKNDGWAVTYIHGGLPMGDLSDISDPKEFIPFNNTKPRNRLISMEWFRNEANILVATDAAGEGVDLEFCNYLINWDLPWNPTRLEQRMGRIHRYGQLKTSYVYNFVLFETVEGRVQSIILDKLEQIRDDYEEIEKGSGDRVFDVISSFLKDNEVSNTVKEMERKIGIEKDKYAKKFGEDIKKKIEKFLKKTEIHVKSNKLRECLGLKTEFKDVETEIERFRRARREAPEYLRDFFLAAWEVIGGSIRTENDDGKLEEGIFEINHKEPELFNFSYNFPIYITFQKQKSDIKGLEILRRGNKLFDKVVYHFRNLYSDILNKGEILIDSKSEQIYLIYFYLVSFKNKTGDSVLKKVILLKIDQKTDEITEKFFSRSHLGLSIANDGIAEVASKYWIHFDKQKKVEKWLVNEGLDKIVAPVKKELKIIYDPIVSRLENSMNEYYRQFNKVSKNYPKNIRASRREELKNQENEIDLQIEDYNDKLIIFPEKPKIISKAIVIPGYYNGQGIVLPVENYRELLDGGLKIRNSGNCSLKQGEIDRRGIDSVMNFEKKKGRIPFSVEKSLGLGYDIDSYQNGKIVRKIEVKSHYETGNITLERYEKNHFEREPLVSWVYIVDNCKKDNLNERTINQIHLITDKYKFEEYKYTNIRYPISENKWKEIVEEKLT